MKKLNNKGISELIIALIVVVIGVAAFGTYKLVSSSAASKSKVSVGNGRLSKKGPNTIFIITVKGSKKTLKHVKVYIGNQRTELNSCYKNTCDYSTNIKGHHRDGYYTTTVLVKGKKVYYSKPHYRIWKY